MLEPEAVRKTGKIKTNFISHFANDVSIWIFVFVIKVKGMGALGLDLLEQTLIYDPTKRISAKRMLDHEYFDGFDKCLLVPSH